LRQFPIASSGVAQDVILRYICQAIVSDGLLEVFTGQREVLTVRLCDLADGQFGLFAQECRADFANLTVNAL